MFKLSLQCISTGSFTNLLLSSAVYVSNYILIFLLVDLGDFVFDGQETVAPSQMKSVRTPLRLELQIKNHLGEASDPMHTPKRERYYLVTSQGVVLSSYISVSGVRQPTCVLEHKFAWQQCVLHANLIKFFLNCFHVILGFAYYHWETSQSSWTETYRFEQSASVICLGFFSPTYGNLFSAVYFTQSHHEREEPPAALHTWSLNVTKINKQIKHNEFVSSYCWNAG